MEGQLRRILVAARCRERGIPHLAVVPCLLLTFLFGPAGWLAYSGLRTAYGFRGVRT